MANYRMSEYQGGYNSLDPNKAYSSSFTGYRATAGSLGITTDPRSANILKEASSKLSSGIKDIELALVQPEIFDSIPKQHLKEINQLSKLTGIDISVHGPVIDSAGFTREGYSDVSREAAQRRIADVLIRSQEVNPKGNVPVVFHSAEGIPGSEWKTLGDEKKGESRQAKRLIAVDRETGKMIPLETETKYYPGEEEVEGKKIIPEKGLETVNYTEWDNSLAQIEFNRENAERILQEVHPAHRDLYLEMRTAQMQGRIDEWMKNRTLNEREMEELKRISSAEEFMGQARLNANAAFNKAYKTAQKDNDQKTLEYLRSLSKQYGDGLGVKDSEKRSLASLDPKTQSNAMFRLISGLKEIQPRSYIPIEEFATEKSAETFGNAAFQAYKKHKDKTPIMAIENPPAGMGLSTGEDLKNLVTASRKKFAENLIEEGINKKQAEKTAEKFIGATWDVGHINMLRKQGFSEEDIIKETEKIAPFIKHVHLSDNFGFEHTELPMGMGNVPMKEIMEKLGQKGFEAKKIIEAGNWWQHFQTNPFNESLEGLGSPMYSGAPSATVGGMPYWNQSLGFQQSYSEGFGRMLPGINYQTFGAGFSQLPSHLGGEMQGGQGSRMSNRPME
jgi:sugar phosphate isomerase/epimerase